MQKAGNRLECALSEREKEKGKKKRERERIADKNYKKIMNLRGASFRAEKNRKERSDAIVRVQASVKQSTHGCVKGFSAR